ncbi:MAG TPA: short-chain dehydrogenase/reductase SDR, partial [Myxococcota bacterium]|nr:short-chain dehydrogenase/reductase SDR [Myxococcota bacterium]
AAGPLHAILANAGIMALAERTLIHGYEAQLFTNHIGHFLLVTSLSSALTDDARVILTSSGAHTYAPRGGIDFDNLDASKGYDPWVAYGQSKMANILFAVELARRFQGTARTANAVHPGVIRTNLARNMGAVAVAADVAMAVMGPFVLKSVGEGAATQTWGAVHPDAASISGEYLADCNVAVPRADARDLTLAAKLWARSEEIVAAL